MHRIVEARRPPTLSKRPSNEDLRLRRLKIKRDARLRRIKERLQARLKRRAVRLNLRDLRHLAKAARRAVKATARLSRKRIRDLARALRKEARDIRKAAKLQKSRLRDAARALSTRAQRPPRPVRPPRVRRKKTGTRIRMKDRVIFTFQNFDRLGQPLNRGETPVFLDRLTDNYQRPGPLRREIFSVSSGSDSTIIGNSAEYVNIIGTALPYTSSWSFVEPYLNRLKWKKLPTSNQADLLTNLAELDDTLLMMSKNIRKSASYGGVKWGWLPLVNDIMAANDAANSVKNSVLDGNRRTASYRVNDTFTVVTQPLPSVIGTVKHSWDVKVKYRGLITYENSPLAFFDYMGFHPSPKLLWDIIPLTFAIDTILPIGDMLKALTPAKGWTKSANFTGWRVIDATVTETLVKIRPDYATVPKYPSVRIVQRDYLDGVAFAEKRVLKTIEVLKTPTWEQAFDLAYLSEAFYNRGKKLISPHVYRRRKN